MSGMKYILITGAYGGMGRAAVDMLAARGYGVFALDRRAAEDDRQNVIPINADVTDTESIRRAVERVRGITDSLFAVIHFAGIYMLDSLVEMSEADFDRICHVNVYGVFNINKAFMPFLGSGGRIIITTSELAPLDPLPFTGIYAVTKGALDKYAYSLRMELQLLGIDVSAIRAGAVKTDMLGASTAALDRFCERTSLYKYNSKRFHRIVDSVEAKCIPPQKLAAKAVSVLERKHPKFAYSINRNPLLLMLNALPHCLQFRIIRLVLK